MSKPAPKHTLSWLKALSKLYRYIIRLHATAVTSSLARVSTISTRAFNAVSKGAMAIPRTRKASCCHWSNRACSVIRVVMRKRFTEGAWEVESDRFGGLDQRGRISQRVSATNNAVWNAMATSLAFTRPSRHKIRMERSRKKGYQRSKERETGGKLGLAVQTRTRQQAASADRKRQHHQDHGICT